MSPGTDSSLGQSARNKESIANILSYFVVLCLFRGDPGLLSYIIELGFICFFFFFFFFFVLVCVSFFNISSFYYSKDPLAQFSAEKRTKKSFIFNGLVQGIGSKILD